MSWSKIRLSAQCSTESSGFALRLEESENVALPDGSLNVSDEGSVLSANEANLNLCNTSS